MREMGYVPLNGSGSLQAGVSRVAVLIKDNPRSREDNAAFYTDHNIFHYDIVMGLREYAENKSMEIIMLTVNDDGQRDCSYDEFLRSRFIDGAFIYGLRPPDPFFLQLQITKIPTVILDFAVDNPLVGRVGVDNVAGATLAVEHLISQGHQKIGFLNMNPKSLAAQDRFTGYAAALCRHGLCFDRSLVREEDATEQSGKEGADYFAETGISALFCSCDLQAVGAIQRFRERGIDVPRDISVVGFDGLPFTGYYTPRLTTVAQDRRQIGLSAGALLSGLMSGEPIRHCILMPFLIERESTTAPTKVP
jgi:DNA-binding LacI/PurR family transcriptional regulator